MPASSGTADAHQEPRFNSFQHSKPPSVSIVCNGPRKNSFHFFFQPPDTTNDYWLCAIDMEREGNPSLELEGIANDHQLSFLLALAHTTAAAEPSCTETMPSLFFFPMEHIVCIHGLIRDEKTNAYVGSRQH